jgi:hypothetical protein
MIPLKRAASPMAPPTEPAMTDRDIDTCVLGCLASRVIDAAREAQADGARLQDIGKALIMLGRAFIAAAHHEPSANSTRTRHV